MSATVLIVDDDPVQRRLAEAAVRRFGFEARIAETGADALTLLRSEGAFSISRALQRSRYRPEVFPATSVQLPSREDRSLLLVLQLVCRTSFSNSRIENPRYLEDGLAARTPRR